MYEDITPESIKQDIFYDLPMQMDTREGSYLNNLISPLAYELWKMYQSLNAVIPIAFVDETSGEYIDRRAGEFGITRREGTRAKVDITVTGTEGAMIPAGTVILTPDSKEYTVDSNIRISGETGTGKATAALQGEDGNAEQGTVFQLYKSISGIEGITAAENGEGGTNPETDAALVQRLYEHWRRPATSGNVYHYEQWAKEVAGVGAVKVFPLARGAGTVDLVLIDSAGKPASPELVDNVAKYIEPLRPIGADVQVSAATEKVIVVEAELIMLEGASFEAARQQIEAAIRERVGKDAFTASAVSYNRMGYLILAVEGVQDYRNLTLNGAAEDVPITEREVAVVTSVNLTQGVQTWAF